jgi:hypothetical protein
MRFALIILSIVWSVIETTAETSEKAADYQLFKSIQAPQELLFPHFPSSYCASVQVSGGVAEEIRTTIEALHLPPPKFRESFDGKTFRFFLANQDYPPETRELLSGILNPLELIDLIVQSLLELRDPKKFKNLVNTTFLTKQIGIYNKRQVYFLKLGPKDKRFAYRYDDRGAYIQERWLTGLTVVVDTASLLVHKIVEEKYGRRFEVNTQSAEIDTLITTYLFDYNFKDDMVFPKHLKVMLNDHEMLSIKTSYREFRKKYVFDEKVVCCRNGKNTTTCLELTYNEYRRKKCKTKKPAHEKPNQNYAKKLIGAAQLSRKASELLREGNISESIRVFQELIERYEGTPQAIEAQRLLLHLPH